MTSYSHHHTHSREDSSGSSSAGSRHERHHSRHHSVEVAQQPESTFHKLRSSTGSTACYHSERDLQPNSQACSEDNSQNWRSPRLPVEHKLHEHHHSGSRKRSHSGDPGDHSGEPEKIEPEHQTPTVRKRSNSESGSSPVPEASKEEHSPLVMLPMGVEDGPTNSWCQIDATTLMVKKFSLY